MCEGLDTLCNRVRPTWERQSVLACVVEVRYLGEGDGVTCVSSDVKVEFSLRCGCVASDVVRTLVPCRDPKVGQRWNCVLEEDGTLTNWESINGV